MPSVDSVDSVDETWNVELASELAVAPSEGLVLPAAEYSGMDVIDVVKFKAIPMGSVV